MKLRSLIILLFLAQYTYGQINDDFSDADLTSNPQWTGELVNFETALDFVDLDNSLHLNAPVQIDTSILVTPSEAINNASWEFTVMLDFGTSSSNYAEVYLASDSDDLEGNVNGYFVRVGGSSDEVSLYERSDMINNEIIDGTDSFIGSDPVIVRVKVTRDDLGNWELSADNTGGTTYTSQGTVFNDQHISSNYFGVFCKYTSTRSDLFYYDDIVVTGTAFIDNVPPELESITVVTNQSLRLDFNEGIDPSTFNIPENYEVSNGIGMPSTIGQPNSDLIDLSFADAFENGLVYEIEITGLTDLAGNDIGMVTEEFFFFLPGTPQEGDVIFNEIMADPTPSQGSAEVEFVELYNASESVFELEDWIFVNSTTPKTLPSFPLLQDSYVILCDENDVTLLEPHGDVIGIPSFTALNNGGDSLTLLSNTSLVLDIVKYSDDWYEDPVYAAGGYSLERKDPTALCSGSSNWGSNMSALGSTPAMLNSNFDDTPDTSVPEIDSYEIEDPQTLIIIFNEAMDLISLEFGTYQIDNGIDVISNTLVNGSDDRVRLALSGPLVPSTTYQLMVSNVFDCEGNQIGIFTIDILTGFAPLPGEVIFTEILSDPSPVVGLPEAEYLELYNTTEKLINLSDCKVDEAVFPANTFLPAYSYVLVSSIDNSTSFFSYDNFVAMDPWSSSFLINSGEILVLKDPEGILINSITYDISVHDPNKDEGGWSLEMINLNEPCRGISNWASSTNFQGGTPGIQNSINSDVPDLVGPRLLDITVIDAQNITLHFDETLDSLITPLLNIEIDNGLDDLINDISGPEYRTVNVLLSNAMSQGTIYNLSISDLTDCLGNVIGNDNTGLFALPEDGVVGDLIINEILFNPPEGVSDFIEIYNRTSKVISLQDWRVANIENGIPDNLKVISETGKLIFPNSYLVLTADENALESAYANGEPSNFWQLSSLPSYNNDEGTAVLLLPNAEVSDEFYYQEDYHFTLLDIVKGFSLERIDPERITNDPSNWHSASTLEGGATPGKMNSQFYQSAISESTIQIEPEVFTPDNDGFEDFLNINYLFDEPGFIAKMDIFDSRGVLIKELVRNELLGTTGVIKWDGSTEDQDKAPIGVYVIFVEIFDVEGNISQFKKTCVVGSRF